MKLPQPDQAVIDIVKLRDYCLSAEHRRGQHKARVFAAALGLTAVNAEDLQAALQRAIYLHEAIPTEQDEYGQRYVVDFMLTWRNRQALVRSSWIVRQGENFPRLTSCYVL